MILETLCRIGVTIYGAGLFGYVVAWPRCADCGMHVPLGRGRRNAAGRRWVRVQIPGRRFWLCAWCVAERRRGDGG